MKQIVEIAMETVKDDRTSSWEKLARVLKRVPSTRQIMQEIKEIQRSKQKQMDTVYNRM